MIRMTGSVQSGERACVFCAIVAKDSEASVVYEDESVVAFMDAFPVTPGHLLVVPRQHVVGLEDIDDDSSAHVWSVGHAMARALRRSQSGCEGINVLLCDGEAAFQTVFHLHLHIIPRYLGDGWNIVPEPMHPERTVLEADAQRVRNAISMTD